MTHVWTLRKRNIKFSVLSSLEILSMQLDHLNLVSFTLLYYYILAMHMRKQLNFRESTLYLCGMKKRLIIILYVSGKVGVRHGYIFRKNQPEKKIKDYDLFHSWN